MLIGWAKQNYVTYFLKNFIISPVGVTTRKNIIPIIIGDNIVPRNNPNLNQIILSGLSILELNRPRIKNIILNPRDHSLIELSFSNG